MDRHASMSVQFSRGCPFDCEFCNVTAMFGHRPRTKTPAQVITELDGLCRAGWRGAVFFVDGVSFFDFDFHLPNDETRGITLAVLCFHFSSRN